MSKRVSTDILSKCIELQEKKGRDYQNPNSSIKQADYYPHGVWSIYDVMNAKMLRLKSVLEAMENDGTYNQNFESLSDSAMDLINYTSFFAAYLEHGIDGQDPDKNIFNKYNKVNQDKQR